MKKAERIEIIAKEFEVKKSEAERLEKKFMEMVKRELVSHGKFELEGIGTLRIDKVEARNGRNPKTKEKIVIPAHKACKFKVKKSFKEEIK